MFNKRRRLGDREGTIFGLGRHGVFESMGHCRVILFNIGNILTRHKNLEAVNSLPCMLRGAELQSQTMSYDYLFNCTVQELQRSIVKLACILYPAPSFIYLFPLHLACSLRGPPGFLATRLASGVISELPIGNNKHVVRITSLGEWVRGLDIS